MPLKNPLTLNTIVMRQADLTFADVDDDLVILSIPNSKYYGAEAAGKRIWQLIAQPMSLLQICDNLLNEFDVDRSTCETEVLAFIDQLIDENLVKISDS